MTRNKTVTIIGTGLIGGSIAYALRKHKMADKIIGVEKQQKAAMQALSLGIVDEIQQLKAAVDASYLVVLAVPVSTIQNILPKVLDYVTTQIVFDVGSTKQTIIATVQQHKNRHRFVATHPMWGTEYSGPTAAQSRAFKGKAVVICNANESANDAVRVVTKLYTKLGMHVVNMMAMEHDLHTAYVSHISHITSFALANTVLQKETETATIFELASGGFESTVRLAKSNAAMWTPILMQNRKNILDVLRELEVQIAAFKKHLIQQNKAGITQLIKNANKIKRILK
jgi:prephenate dehydrogenase